MSAADLRTRLDLADEEVLRIFAVDPLSVVSGELDSRPEVAIMLALTDELDESVLRRWLRRSGTRGKPIELLLAHDFAGFEDAVLDLRERGIVLRSGLQQEPRPVD